MVPANHYKLTFFRGNIMFSRVQANLEMNREQIFFYVS